MDVEVLSQCDSKQTRHENKPLRCSIHACRKGFKKEDCGPSRGYEGKVNLGFLFFFTLI